ncbi:iduronate 2-sulfatase-like [Gigantopelta aegis]|uniref:iduronate 2-sulfatase-like n=1 Tax=Gigantopelta aegis TaxID=1735272 RepID=UPI001B887DAD|nr:iduronate 2-sulfatase-like [Gigantopelta aegis]
MVSVPGLTDHGVVTEQLTEFVDLFPTLVDAAGLPPLPFCPVDSADIATCTEGMSLMPLMKNPNAKWKTAAFSQYPRHGSRVMSYSIRTDRYRYTEWAKFHGKPVYKPDWRTLYGIELYDHQHDPQENINLINDPQHAATRHHLSQRLRAGWRAEVQGLK